MIPFLDLKAPYLELQPEIDQAIARVLNSGWYIGGAEVEQFEAEFAEFCGAKYCAGVANGLDALHLALIAMGVGPGDEVIVPSNTYIATWLAVSQCGAVPVPVEPDPFTYNLDVKRIEAAITHKTKVILPVHLYGLPADLGPILAIAKKLGLLVLEDAAQAHAAEYAGAPIGGHGHAVAWSYYPGKNLGALGDGGGITTNDPELAERIRVLRNYGSRVKYVNDIRGFNSRLDPIQAAVLRVKLKHLKRWNNRRAKIASMYLDGLKGVNAVLPVVPANMVSAWHLFVIRVENRNDVQAALRSSGVETLIHYPIPPHRQNAYASEFDTQAADPFPLATLQANTLLSLPIGPHLNTETATVVIECVCAALA